MTEPIEEKVSEILIRLAEMSENNRAVWRRMDEQHKFAETVNETVLTVRDLVHEVKGLRVDHDVMNRELEELKSKPAKRYDGVIQALINCVAVALVSGALALALNK